MKTVTTFELALALGVTNEWLMGFINEPHIKLGEMQSQVDGYISHDDDVMEFMELTLEEVIALLREFFAEDGAERYQVLNVINVIERMQRLR